MILLSKIALGRWGMGRLASMCLVFAPMLRGCWIDMSIEPTGWKRNDLACYSHIVSGALHACKTLHLQTVRAACLD